MAYLTSSHSNLSHPPKQSHPPGSPSISEEDMASASSHSNPSNPSEQSHPRLPSPSTPVFSRNHSADRSPRSESVVQIYNELGQSLEQGGCQNRDGDDGDDEKHESFPRDGPTLRNKGAQKGCWPCWKPVAGDNRPGNPNNGGEGGGGNSGGNNGEEDGGDNNGSGDNGGGDNVGGNNGGGGNGNNGDNGSVKRCLTCWKPGGGNTPPAERGGAQVLFFNPLIQSLYVENSVGGIA